MIPWYRRLVASAAATAATIGLVGCSSGEQTAAPGEETDQFTVVASTDVWASVVRAVAGDAVEVQTIIDDPSVDPHAYESTPADAATVLGADMVVYNGGGYDGFVEEILDQAEDSLDDRPDVEAVVLADARPHTHDQHSDDTEGVSDTAHDDGTHGHDDAHGDDAHGDDAHGDDATEDHAHEHGDNEHVWYDLPVVASVATEVAEELGELLPERSEQFTANAERFDAEIDELRDTVSRIAAEHGGTSVATTEPVAFYLLEAARLDDVTPGDFVDAVERETDPPAAALAATLDLLREGQVSVLIYNTQTETPVTRQVHTEAESAGIPVVEMTETLPPGGEYVGWMSGQIDALSDALG